MPPQIAQAGDRVDDDGDDDRVKHAATQQEQDSSPFKKESDTERPTNPLPGASVFSKLFFCWPYDSILKLGMERPLVETDLSHLLEADTSAYNANYFFRLLEKSIQSGYSLQYTVLVDFFISIWYVQPFMAAAATAKVVQAVALGKLIDSFYYSHSNISESYAYAGLIVLCGAVILFEHHHVFFWNWRKGMQIRLAAVAAIYEKSLRLLPMPSTSNAADESPRQNMASYGQIMNLVSNDVERFMLASLFLSHLIWAPIQSVAILVVGCILLESAAFAAGFALLCIVFVPLQFYWSGRFAFFRSKIASLTDQRVTFVSQAVRGARVMKMGGYEHRFLDRIMLYREKEIKQIVKANRLKSWNEALFFVTNVVVAMAIFFVHVMLLDKTLRPGNVFTVFTLINVLQLELTKHVSLGVMGASECHVSLTRIRKFLELPELQRSKSRSEGVVLDAAESSNQVLEGPNCKDDTTKEVHRELQNSTEPTVLSLHNVTCHWGGVGIESVSKDMAKEEGSSPLPGSIVALQDVSLDFSPGSLTAIIGSVGSGKSALLQAIIQELPLSSGQIRRKYNTMSYASQDPWIMDGTIRENICMGLPFRQDWYDQVIWASALEVDLQEQQWQKLGDLTIVGDRGIQCSGGQRARIGLARALYRDADILIVDDPLSAVDAKVGRHLFQNALTKLMLDRKKCVVLATHQHQYVHDCRCVLIQKGSIVRVGTYEDCVEASGGTLALHEADVASQEKSNKVEGAAQEASKAETGPMVSKADATEVPSKEGATENEDQKESSNQGVVKADTYVNYIKAMGGLWVGVSLAALFTLTQGSVLTTVATFGRWAEREDQKSWDVVGLALGLTGFVIVLATFRALLSLRLTVKASQKLHDTMAKSVLRARISFFDTNPLGRILNRFSADVGSNDDLLPPTLFDFSMCLFIVLGAVATTISTLPFTLVAFVPLVWYFLSVRQVFVTSTRELKRLEGLARSPIFAMLSESLSGVATIRANDAVPYFRKKFQGAHDGHTRAFFAFIAASRWVGFRMDGIMFLFLSTASLLSVIFQDFGWFDVDPAILGLSLSMLLQLAGLFQWCIRQSAEVVNQMVSVERVLAYGKLEPEADLVSAQDESLTAKGWPQDGAIQYDNVCVRYRKNLPPALRGVSFTIPARTRVGIVGRTGSGKSSLVQSLFRLLEAEEGQIWIDGVDVSTLGLHALRTRISVIPQVPTLFSGCSVRENLDLFNLHSDDEIRQVLDVCHLSDVVSELPEGWNSKVAESGSNFSVGQRQLLCLARALLSNNPIIVLDEATASVDRKTDHLLQDALKESQGTILAVAHRLDTVIDNDFILVLGNGQVLEFGSPQELIEKDGAFASMVRDTGEKMAHELCRRARKEQAS